MRLIPTSSTAQNSNQQETKQQTNQDLIQPRLKVIPFGARGLFITFMSHHSAFQRDASQPRHRPCLFRLPALSMHTYTHTHIYKYTPQGTNRTCLTPWMAKGATLPGVFLWRTSPRRPRRRRYLSEPVWRPFSPLSRPRDEEEEVCPRQIASDVGLKGL